MWGDDNGPYHGKHYRLAETLKPTQPLRRPHRRSWSAAVGSARPCGWSSATPTPESAAGFVEEMKPYADLGIREVVLMPFGPDPVGFVGRLAGTVVSDLAGL